jgi:ABC-type transporter Mla subunit MlaD
VVTVAVGIGFLCNALILIASFVSIIYASLVFLLENHHHVSLLREKQLTAEVQRLEQTLVDALEHFRAIEHSLREVLTSLYALNHQQAEDIQAFQAQIVQLQTETSRLSELNTSVHLSRNALLESTTHFSAVVGDMESTMMTLGQTLSDEIGKLDKTDAKLTTTNTSLQADQTR